MPNLIDTPPRRFVAFETTGGNTLLIEREIVRTAGGGVVDPERVDRIAAEAGVVVTTVRGEAVKLDRVVEIGPDPSYMDDLARVDAEIRRACDALTTIVAAGAADYDSTVGRSVGEAGDLLAEIGERVVDAIDNPEGRTASLLRGAR